MEEKKVKNVDYESQLERFRHIQGTLARIYGCCDEDVDLLEVTNDCVPLDEEGSMCIERVPLKGDNVTMTVCGWEKDREIPTFDKILPLSTFSAGIVSKVLNVMHRAMIIEEIRNHVEY